MRDKIYLTSSHNLFSDGFFIKKGRLMFASLHGRDSDIMAFLAAITLGAAQGFHSLGFRTSEEVSLYPIERTAASFSNLSKRMTKYMSHNYGMLTHMFLYAEDLLECNQDNKTAWLLREETAGDLSEEIWHYVEQLSNIPLLPAWETWIVAQLKERESILFFQPSDPISYSTFSGACIRGAKAAFVSIPHDFADIVADGLRSGALRV